MVSDGAAESPGESLLRLDLLQLGFARLTLQPEIPGESGKVYRPDIALLDLGVLLEFDGRVKYESAGGDAALVREKRREDDLRLAGWGIVRVTWSELGQLDLLSRRIARAARTSRRAQAAS